MFLTFIGAAGTVTGSKLLVECDGAPLPGRLRHVPGPRRDRPRNSDLPFGSTRKRRRRGDPDPRPPRPLRIPAGPRPRRIRRAGLLLAELRLLVPIILRDSARLQAEDTAWARKKGFSRHARPEPLYDVNDASVRSPMLRPVEFAVEFHPVDGSVAALVLVGTSWARRS